MRSDPQVPLREKPAHMGRRCAGCHGVMHDTQVAIMLRHSSTTWVEFCSDRCSKTIPAPKQHGETGIEYRPVVGWYAACSKCGENLTEGGDFSFWMDTPPDFAGVENDADNVMCEGGHCPKCEADLRSDEQRAEDEDDA